MANPKEISRGTFLKMMFTGAASLGLAACTSDGTPKFLMPTTLPPMDGESPQNSWQLVSQNEFNGQTESVYAMMENGKPVLWKTTGLSLEEANREAEIYKIQAPVFHYDQSIYKVEVVKDATGKDVVSLFANNILDQDYLERRMIFGWQGAVEEMNQARTMAIFLYNNGIVVTDLSPGNIRISYDGLHAALIDFEHTAYLVDKPGLNTPEKYDQYLNVMWKEFLNKYGDEFDKISPQIPRPAEVIDWKKVTNSINDRKPLVFKPTAAVIENKPVEAVNPIQVVGEASAKTRPVIVVLKDGRTLEVFVPKGMTVTYETLMKLGIDMPPASVPEKILAKTPKLFKPLVFLGVTYGVIAELSDAAGLGNSSSISNAVEYRKMVDRNDTKMNKLIRYGNNTYTFKDLLTVLGMYESPAYYQYFQNLNQVFSSANTKFVLFKDTNSMFTLRTLEDQSKIHLPLITEKYQMPTGIMIILDGPFDENNIGTGMTYYNPATGESVKVKRAGSSWKIDSNNFLEYSITCKSPSDKKIEVKITMRLEIVRDGDTWKEQHTPVDIEMMPIK